MGPKMARMTWSCWPCCHNLSWLPFIHGYLSYVAKNILDWFCNCTVVKMLQPFQYKRLKVKTRVRSDPTKSECVRLFWSCVRFHRNTARINMEVFGHYKAPSYVFIGTLFLTSGDHWSILLHCSCSVSCVVYVELCSILLCFRGLDFHSPEIPWGPFRLPCVLWFIIFLAE